MMSGSTGRYVGLHARKPLLQMTASELIAAYVRLRSDALVNYGGRDWLTLCQMTPLTLGVYLSFFLYGIFIVSSLATGCWT
jgi:hypothetical protein